MYSRTNIILLIFVFLSFLLYILAKTPPLKAVESFFQETISSPLGFFYSLKIQSSKNSDLEKIYEENKKLKYELLEFEKIKKDNLALRSQFEISEGNSQKLTPARIIGFTGSSSHPEYLIIDKGEKDGMRKGMGVVVEKMLVGKIEECSYSFSKLILSSNKKFSTVARTVQTDAKGVIHGEGDFIIFQNVSSRDILKSKDMVVTKGDINENGIGLPPDLIIGFVSSVNKSESNPLQGAKVEGALKWQELTLVFVISGF